MSIFDDVYLVDQQLTLVDSTEIDHLENHLELMLPSGYREMLTVLGIGTY